MTEAMQSAMSGESERVAWSPPGTLPAETWSAIADAMVEAMVATDASGNLVLFNRAAERTFGYTAHEVLGRNVEMLLPQRRDRKATRSLDRYLRAQLRRGLGTTRQTRAHHRNGGSFPIKLSVGEFWTDGERGYVAVIRDISHRYRREVKLRNTTEQMRLLLEFSPTPVMVTDSTGHILNANDACLDLVGFELSSIQQQRLSDLVVPDDRASVLSDIERIRAGLDVSEREISLLHQEGRMVPVVLYAGCARDDAGEPLLYVGALLDRTPIQKATREVAELRERLMHAARLGTLGEMVSGIAHEVNQPLTAIAAYTGACKRMLGVGSTTSLELIEILDKVSRQAERAGQVIRGLRGMVRPQETRHLPLDVNHLIEEVARLATVDVGGTTERLALDLAPNLPQVLGDGVQIQQVVMNLIRNSLEAMREARRGSEVHVQTRPVDATAVEIAVADQGPGLAQDVQDRLFDPFVTTKSHGMGLGLSICRSIVSSHAGELFYRRGANGGAVFVVRLPVLETSRMAEE